MSWAKSWARSCDAGMGNPPVGKRRMLVTHRFFQREPPEALKPRISSGKLEMLKSSTVRATFFIVFMFHCSSWSFCCISSLFFLPGDGQFLHPCGRYSWHEVVSSLPLAMRSWLEVMSGLQPCRRLSPLAWHCCGVVFSPCYVASMSVCFFAWEQPPHVMQSGFDLHFSTWFRDERFADAPLEELLSGLWEV